MAHNFNNTYTADLIGLWDFRQGQENDDTGLDDGIAQDGSQVGGAATSSGWLLSDGQNDRFDVLGEDAPFDLSEGTIVAQFSQICPIGSAPNTVVSRGIADQGDTEGFFEIRVTADGAVETFHTGCYGSEVLATGPGFLAADDVIKVTYSWSETDGARMLVENLTQGDSVSVEGSVAGLTMAMDTDCGQNFVIAAHEASDETFGQHFNGAVDYVAVLDQPVLGAGDGIVEGTAGNDLIDIAYTGDPEGDMIDAGDAILPGEAAQDDIVDAGAGDDVVRAGLGDDDVHAGSGDDTVFGGSGDDVIRGDGNLADGGGAIRESFEWDLAPDPNGAGGIDDGDDLSAGFSQNTGTVDVTYSVVDESAGVDTEFNDQDQNVAGIDTGGGAADDDSALQSILNGQSNSAAYKLEFSQVVENISFRINDIDGDGVVRVQAFDAAGNLIPVQMSGGADVTLSDEDAVAGNETADSNGGYDDPDSAGYSVLVAIPGPVAHLVIAHDQDGGNNSGVTVTDVYFDVPMIDTGVDGDDVLHGGDGDDLILGQGGDDTITGGDGSDSVSGGDGDDVIDTRGSLGTNLPDRGFAGYNGLPAVPADADIHNDRDVVDGGDGDDLILTGDDMDVITGGTGDDTIDAGLDDDDIGGGAGDDVIVGGEGADTITGGAGDDLIYGGLDPSLPDFLNIRDDGSAGPADPDPGNGLDVIDGGAGNDTIFGQDDADRITGGTGDDFIDGGIDNDTVSGGDGSDIILGGQGDDDLSGGAGTDLVLGGSGDDTIAGDGGSDLLDGGDGDDVIDGGGDVDALFGDAGADTLSGGDDSDLILGGDGDDVIHGDGADGEGNTAGGAGDVLFGGAGDDLIIGGSGDDILDGADGADTMTGGADQDIFIEVGVGDEIDGSESGNDFDTIVINGPAIVHYDPNDPEAGTIDFYDLGTMTVTGTASFRNIENVRHVEHVVNPGLPLAAPAPPPGGEVSDMPLPPPPVPSGTLGIVDGTSGIDFIDLAYTGDPEGDRIDAGDAVLPGEAPDDDIVHGYDGDDVIHAELGDDDVFGGDGSDFISGGVGNDILRGEDGDDLLFGEAGNDQLSGGDGNDIMDGGLDNDVLEGGDGDDDMAGNIGNDALYGGDGDDTLKGGDGSDLILGGDGEDQIDLGSDDDRDLVFGNDDSDRFTGVGQDDTIDGGEDSDNLDHDVLDLSDAAETANPGGSLTVEYDPLNGENGVVHFFDAGGAETGTSRFYNIEEVIVPCFTPGTLIATPRGERLVEELKAGDRVITRDNGIQDIRWIGTRHMTGQELARAEHLCPILIRQGALGNGLPERDMMVSPNHRVLVANDKTALYFEDREVLVAAKHLTGLEGIETVAVPGVSYIHFMFAQHEVVLSDGAWTESFQPGDQTLKGIGSAQRNEIYELFPELQTQDGLRSYSAARRSLKRHEARLLM